MKIFIINFSCTLLLFGSVKTITRAQAPPFSRGFYSSVVAPTSSHYSYHYGSGGGGGGGGGASGGFAPLTYKSDLIPEESKHRHSSKYSKKPSYKGYNSDEDEFSSEIYTSDEFLNEAKHPFTSKERDSQEYTIGSHIRVQHPIKAPKKSTIPFPTKSTKYTNLPDIGSYTRDVSYEEHGSDSYLPSSSSKKQKHNKHYEPDPFRIISPPKSKTPSHHHISQSSAPSFNTYDPEAEFYENGDLTVKHFKTNLRDRFKNVASKKQIEKYIEDQEKLLDEALKLQLLNSPKFQKLLKTAEKEQQFKQSEFEEEYIANVPPPFRDTFPKSVPQTVTRSRRRPSKSAPNRKYRSALVIKV